MGDCIQSVLRFCQLYNEASRCAATLRQSTAFSGDFCATLGSMARKKHSRRPPSVVAAVPGWTSNSDREGGQRPPLIPLLAAPNSHLFLALFHFSKIRRNRLDESPLSLPILGFLLWLHEFINVISWFHGWDRKSHLVGVGWMH